MNLWIAACLDYLDDIAAKLTLELLTYACQIKNLLPSTWKTTTNVVVAIFRIANTISIVPPVVKLEW